MPLDECARKAELNLNSALILFYELGRMLMAHSSV